MVTIQDDHVWSGGEKIGYLEGARFFDMDGTEMGYYENDAIYNAGGRKIGYLENDYIYNIDGSVYDRIERNHEAVNGGSYSNLCCAAVSLLFGN